MDRLIPIIVLIPVFVFWVWMLWDISNRHDLSSKDKINWTLIVGLFNVFGAVFYYVNEHQNRH